MNFIEPKTSKLRLEKHNESKVEPLQTLRGIFAFLIFDISILRRVGFHQWITGGSQRRGGVRNFQDIQVDAIQVDCFVFFGGFRFWLVSWGVMGWLEGMDSTQQESENLSFMLRAVSTEFSWSLFVLYGPTAIATHLA